MQSSAGPQKSARSRFLFLTILEGLRIRPPSFYALRILALPCSTFFVAFRVSSTNGECSTTKS